MASFTARPPRDFAILAAAVTTLRYAILAQREAGARCQAAPEVFLRAMTPAPTGAPCWPRLVGQPPL